MLFLFSARQEVSETTDRPTLALSVRQIDRPKHRGSTLTLCSAPTSIRLSRSVRPSPKLAVTCTPPRSLPLAGSKRSFVASTNGVQQSEGRSVRRKSDPPSSSSASRWALRPQDQTEAQRLSRTSEHRERPASQSPFLRRKTRHGTCGLRSVTRCGGPTRSAPTRTHMKAAIALARQTSISFRRLSSFGWWARSNRAYVPATPCQTRSTAMSTEQGRQ